MNCYVFGQNIAINHPTSDWRDEALCKEARAHCFDAALEIERLRSSFSGGDVVAFHQTGDAALFYEKVLAPLFDFSEGKWSLKRHLVAGVPA